MPDTDQFGGVWSRTYAPDTDQFGGVLVEEETCPATPVSPTATGPEPGRSDEATAAIDSARWRSCAQCCPECSNPRTCCRQSGRSAARRLRANRATPIQTSSSARRIPAIEMDQRGFTGPNGEFYDRGGGGDGVEGADRV